METFEVLGGLQASVKLQSSIQKWKLLGSWVGWKASEVMGGLQSSIINLETETSEVLGGLQVSFINQIGELLQSWVGCKLQSSFSQASVNLQSIFSHQSRHGSFWSHGWAGKLLKPWAGCNLEMETSEVMGGLQSSATNLEMETSEVLGGLQA